MIYLWIGWLALNLIVAVVFWCRIEPRLRTWENRLRRERWERSKQERQT